MDTAPLQITGWVYAALASLAGRRRHGKGAARERRRTPLRPAGAGLPRRRKPRNVIGNVFPTSLLERQRQVQRALGGVGSTPTETSPRSAHPCGAAALMYSPGDSRSGDIRCGLAGNVELRFV